jgi:hypothetical protein
MTTLKDFMLGTLLAALLIGPMAWAEAGQMVRTGLSVAAAEFGHGAHPNPVSTTVRSVLAHTP